MSAKIITKTDCIYCTYAKDLLNQKKIPYTEVLIGRDMERKEFLSLGTPKTVPQIWLDDVYIGGFTELKAHFENDRS